MRRSRLRVLHGDVWPSMARHWVGQTLNRHGNLRSLHLTGLLYVRARQWRRVRPAHKRRMRVFKKKNCPFPCHKMYAWFGMQNVLLYYYYDIMMLSSCQSSSRRVAHILRGRR